MKCTNREVYGVVQAKVVCVLPAAESCFFKYPLLMIPLSPCHHHHCTSRVGIDVQGEENDGDGWIIERDRTEQISLSVNILGNSGKKQQKWKKRAMAARHTQKYTCVHTQRCIQRSHTVH